MEKKIHEINLKRDRPIINILGEICWGFQIDNFEKKIGAKKEAVEELLKRLINEEKTGVTETFVTDLDVEIIKRALNEVEKEIEEWEFDARIGVSLNEVRKISIFD